MLKRRQEETMTQPGARKDSVAEIREIAAAIRAGDGEPAGAACRCDIEKEAASDGRKCISKEISH
jgi:DNA-binding GntR family transcriptional regulator